MSTNHKGGNIQNEVTVEEHDGTRNAKRVYNVGGETETGTPTVTSVGDSASSVTLLAANTSRKGATIYNDSTAALYIKLGATASATSFTVKLQQDDYYELPKPVHTGVIDGIWSSDAGGNARITEIT